MHDFSPFFGESSRQAEVNNRSKSGANQGRELATKGSTVPVFKQAVKMCLGDAGHYFWLAYLDAPSSPGYG
jgi:hypothetical protein